VKERIEQLALKTAKLTGGGVVADAKFVSQAITVAVNEALEMAAKECENYPKRDPAEDGSGYWASENCAEAIRKLKCS
jgi:hypothetical protein